MICSPCIHFIRKEISELIGGYCELGYYVDYFVPTLNGVPISLEVCDYEVKD